MQGMMMDDLALAPRVSSGLQGMMIGDSSFESQTRHYSSMRAPVHESSPWSPSALQPLLCGPVTHVEWKDPIPDSMRFMSELVHHTMA